MPQTLKANIGLNDETRGSVKRILDHHLADLHVLYVKTRNYHWNVRGPQFISLHELFEEQYTAMAESIDEVAERVRSLGENPIGSMREFLEIARLQEEVPGNLPSAHDMVAHLLSDHEAVIRQLRSDVDVTGNDCHDVGTSDFLTGLMEAHEKMAWMLRAFLEDHSVN
ncbi:MAG: DNA starvation/stationary phase protection protein [Capsulimonadales bacterium]|nr:DNA starvation/stationary phase protection protein [Capsulimonadales bacterium]